MKIEELKNPPAVDCLIERFGARRLPFALDSAQTNDGLGEWSFFGADPFEVIEGRDGVYRRRRDGLLCETRSGDGLAVLREWMRPYLVPEADCPIPFPGGAVGFLAYDYGRQIERLPAGSVDDRALPDLYFGLYDGLVALERRTGRLWVVALGIRGSAEQTINEIESVVRTPVKRRAISQRLPGAGGWEWNIGRNAYLEAVRRVRAYIASGDVYQVNLSRRARRPFAGEAEPLYRALRAGNPAPYGAWIQGSGFSILSTSPEQFLRKRGRSVETRPIKGTRPRGRNPAEDAALAEALQSSAKDRAELLMIVDLERNDLGRVAAFGSVRVEGMCHLEKYARVMHQTAQVKARLAHGCDVYDCLRALFPGGSITGAPKIRAMEVIDELEPTRRGVYTGSIGYLGFDGNAEFNIAIRTLHLKDGFLDYQVGGGIVWDSDPESEYEETKDKGRAMRETVDSFCAGNTGATPEPEL
ncbi:MAG: aminodeoxychorismate synthase component I [Opitutales bacterium]